MHTELLNELYRPRHLRADTAPLQPTDAAAWVVLATIVVVSTLWLLLSL